MPELVCANVPSGTSRCAHTNQSESFASLTSEVSENACYYRSCIGYLVGPGAGFLLHYGRVYSYSSCLGNHHDCSSAHSRQRSLILRLCSFGHTVRAQRADVGVVGRIFLDAALEAREQWWKPRISWTLPEVHRHRLSRAVRHYYARRAPAVARLPSSWPPTTSPSDIRHGGFHVEDSRHVPRHH